jgi:hypothetical protein
MNNPNEAWMRKQKSEIGGIRYDLYMEPRRGLTMNNPQWSMDAQADHAELGVSDAKWKWNPVGVQLL